MGRFWNGIRRDIKKGKMKLLEHLKAWNKWRKNNSNSKFHKLLVLIGFIHSPTYYVVKEDENYKVY